MGDFFKGWRRKVGVMTLVIACLFAGGWVRSLRIFDEAYYPYAKQSLVGVASTDGLLVCSHSIANTPGYFPREPNWYSMPEQKIESSLLQIRWIAQLCGFRFGVREVLPTQIDEFLIVIVPYWSIVIPFTLLSAWLLLNKPRPSNQNKLPEPIANEGT